MSGVDDYLALRGAATHKCYTCPLMSRTLLSAAKVKAIRESRALTQRQAAKLMGWRRGQSWAKLEWQNTDVRVSTLAALAATFTCTMEDLLEVMPDKPRRSKRPQHS